MGYSTDFYGRFELDRPLASEHQTYLEAFARTRRMQRDVTITAMLPDPIREAAGLPLGIDGAYYVGNTAGFGQDETPDVLNGNEPPDDQPGYRNQWVPSHDGTAIEWDGGEKFYDYRSWLRYIVEHFLKRWGYVLNGTVEWQGEDRDDAGEIIVRNNVVEAYELQRTRGGRKLPAFSVSQPHRSG